MLKRVQFVASALTLTAAVFIANVTYATTIIDASQGVTVRTSGSQAGNNQSGTFGNSLVNGGSNFAYLVQFDLSTITGEIQSAYIRGWLFEDPDSDYTSSDYTQVFYLAKTDPNDSAYDGGINDTTISYTQYAADWDDNQVALETLGDLSIAGTSAGGTGQYYDFAAASTADLAQLNMQRENGIQNSAQNFALFLVRPETPGTGAGYRWWNNQAGDFPLQLVVEVVPEPSAFLLGGLGVAGVALVRRKRK